VRKIISVLLIVVVAVSCTLVASGCGNTSAGGSSRITVYTALEDENVAEYLELFNIRHPEISVDIVRDSTGIITARLLAEKDNPVAKVFLDWAIADETMDLYSSIWDGLRVYLCILD